MNSDMAMERVRRDLRRVLDRTRTDLDRTRTDLDRIEILTAALSAFSRPVLDYEPSFRHMHALALNRHEVN
jgi:hypothetical protein